jgi:hypothetical protein
VAVTACCDQQSLTHSESGYRPPMTLGVKEKGPGASDFAGRRHLVISSRHSLAADAGEGLFDKTLVCRRNWVPSW